MGPLPALLLGLLGCPSPEPGPESGATESSTDTETEADTGTPLPERCSRPALAVSPGGEFIVSDDATAFVFYLDDLDAPDRPCRPLLVMLHGGDSPGGFFGGEWHDPLATGLVDLARQQGLVLMVPFQENAEQVEHSWVADDIETVAALIDEVARQVSIDTDAVLVLGQSSGGHAATAVALEHSDHVTAAAVISAGLASSDSYPEPPPSTLHPFFVAHDPTDSVVPVSASEELVDLLDDQGHFVEAQLDWDLDGHGWNRDLETEVIDWWLAE